MRALFLLLLILVTVVVVSSAVTSPQVSELDVHECVTFEEARGYIMNKHYKGWTYKDLEYADGRYIVVMQKLN